MADAVEHTQVARLCERLGATPAQAGVMAAQLLKRAEQLALERGTDRGRELSRLLELVTQGRAGGVPGDFIPPPPRAP